MIFRQGFSRLTKLSLGTITVNTDLKDQEMSLTTILQENRSLYIVNHFISKPKETQQSACLIFFSETTLQVRSDQVEMIESYKKSITEHESKYQINLKTTLSHIWPGFKSKKREEVGLERETKEKLLSRYLLSLIGNPYEGIVQLELIYLTLKYLVNLTGYYDDGFSTLHKIILSGNSLLLEECFKIGLTLSTDTCDTNAFLPGKLGLTSHNFAAVDSDIGQHNHAQQDADLQTERGPQRSVR